MAHVPMPGVVLQSHMSLMCRAGHHCEGPDIMPVLELLLCKQVGMVMAKVRAGIWSDAPTALLFRAPTIRGLAQEIEAAKGSAAQKTDLAIPRAPFTDAQRAAGVEVLPLQADLLQADLAYGTEPQVLLIFSPYIFSSCNYRERSALWVWVSHCQ